MSGFKLFFSFLFPFSLSPVWVFHFYTSLHHMRISILRRLQHRIRKPVQVKLISKPHLKFTDLDHLQRITFPSSSILPSTMPPKRKRATAADTAPVDVNPDQNPSILDGKTALRASPDAEGKGEVLNVSKVVGKEHTGLLDMDKELEVKPETPAKRNARKTKAAKPQVKQEAKEEPDSELSEVENDQNETEPTNGIVSKDFTEPSADEPTPKKAKKTPTKASKAAKKGSDEIKAFIAEQAALKAANGTATPEATPAKKAKGKAAPKKKGEEDPDEAVMNRDPEADEPEGEKEDVETEKKEAARPPPVNSDYLPLPWKGRLGYVSNATRPLMRRFIQNCTSA